MNPEPSTSAPVPLFPHPYEVQEANGLFPAVFLVDHASNFIPASMNNLGLQSHDLNDHIAWDIGIERVSRQVSQILNIPSLYCLYSRLIVDVNRPLGHTELICQTSDHRIIPKNCNLTPEEKEMRLNEIYHPFHQAARELIAHSQLMHSNRTVIIGMHSCTPQLRHGLPRPWEIGISTHSHDDLVEYVASFLKDEGMHVGIHEPYDCRKSPQGSLYQHAYQNNLPHILIEIRQDLISTESGVQEWAERLSRVFSYLPAFISPECQQAA